MVHKQANKHQRGRGRHEEIKLRRYNRLPRHRFRTKTRKVAPTKRSLAVFICLRWNATSRLTDCDVIRELRSLDMGYSSSTRLANWASERDRFLPNMAKNVAICSSCHLLNLHLLQMPVSVVTPPRARFYSLFKGMAWPLLAREPGQ